jgi:hypothetical protein
MRKSRLSFAASRIILSRPMTMQYLYDIYS